MDASVGEMKEYICEPSRVNKGIDMEPDGELNWGMFWELMSEVFLFLGKACRNVVGCISTDSPAVSLVLATSIGLEVSFTVGNQMINHFE